MSNLFPEWQAAHPPQPILPQRIRTMWHVYGKGNENETCGTCAYFARQGHHNKVYFKCEKSSMSRSEATDWRVGWQSCGLARRRIQ